MKDNFVMMVVMALMVLGSSNAPAHGGHAHGRSEKAAAPVIEATAVEVAGYQWACYPRKCNKHLVPPIAEVTG